MRTVVIVADGDVLATLTWETGRVEIRTEHEMLRQDLRRVRSLDGLGFVDATTGGEYLDAVLAAYSGTYCQAEERT